MQQFIAIVASPEGLAVGGTVGGTVIGFALHQLWKMNASLTEIATLLKQRSFCPLTGKTETSK